MVRKEGPWPKGEGARRLRAVNMLLPPLLVEALDIVAQHEERSRGALIRAAAVLYVQKAAFEDTRLMLRLRERPEMARLLGLPEA